MCLIYLLALNGHHDPSGSPSYPTCLMIGNLGDLTIMEELSKVTILFHRYYTKYHLRFDSIIGQDSPGFANRFVPIHHAAPSDWIAEHPFTNVRPPRQSRPGTIPVKYPYPSPSYKEWWLFRYHPVIIQPTPAQSEGLLVWIREFRTYHSATGRRRRGVQTNFQL